MKPDPLLPIASITEGDLRLMRIFRVVAEAGGLTAAEGRLGMERSTISRHIKALEDRLGASLCHRGPAGFALTELGRAVMHAAIAASDTLDQVRDELNLARGVMTGSVAIGLADNCLTNPDARIADALAAFRAEAPGVALQITVRPPAELLSELMARHLNLCIVGRPLQADRLTLQALFDEEFRLYVGAGPMAPALDALPSLGYGLVSRAGDYHTRALAGRFGLAATATASGLEALATFVATGRFAGFLPTHYAASLATRHALVEVAGADRFRYRAEFFLVQETRRPLSAQGRLLARRLAAAHGSAPPAG